MTFYRGRSVAASRWRSWPRCSLHQRGAFVEVWLLGRYAGMAW